MQHQRRPSEVWYSVAVVQDTVDRKSPSAVEILFYTKNGSREQNQASFKGNLSSLWPDLILSPFVQSYANRGMCRRRVSMCLSVCVSVCVSVTLRYCIKTVKRRITQTTLHDCPMTLVFWCQRSWRNSNGITPYGGDKCRLGGLKLGHFRRKTHYNSKTVQDSFY